VRELVLLRHSGRVETVVERLMVVVVVAAVLVVLLPLQEAVAAGSFGAAGVVGAALSVLLTPCKHLNGNNGRRDTTKADDKEVRILCIYKRGSILYDCGDLPTTPRLREESVEITVWN
jgi:hypothetical protein